MKIISFVAQTGGDEECFHWTDLSQEDKIKVIGEANYLHDREMETQYLKAKDKQLSDLDREQSIDRAMTNLYPDELVNALGCQDGKKYRFTVSIEEI